MMRSSCIAHPPDERLIIIRRWQIVACDGNACAAALLSYFEYWHNRKLDAAQQAAAANAVAELHGDVGTQQTTLWQWHTEADLERGIMIYKRRTIREALALLAAKGFITIGRNPNPRYRFDRTRHFRFHPEAVNAWLRDHYVADDARAAVPDPSDVPNAPTIPVPIEPAEMPDRGAKTHHGAAEPHDGDAEPQHGDANPHDGDAEPPHRAAEPTAAIPEMTDEMTDEMTSEMSDEMSDEQGSRSLPRARARARAPIDAANDERARSPAPSTPMRRASRQRPRDALFEAIVAACYGKSWNAITDTERGMANKAAKELRAIGATPADVHQRAAAYRERCPGYLLLPPTLVKLWSSLGHAPPRSVRSNPRSVSPEDVRRIAAELGLVTADYPPPEATPSETDVIDVKGWQFR